MSETQHIDHAVARDLATNRWLDIFSALGYGRLDEALSKLDNHVPCPVHGGVDGFRLDRNLTPRMGFSICNTCTNPRRAQKRKAGFGDGFQTLMWLNNWTFPQAIEEVYRFCTGASPAAASAFQAKLTPQRPRMSREDTERMILETWRGGVPLSHPDAALARTHLTVHRGLPVPSPDLTEVRYNPRVFYKEGKVKAHLPAFLLRLLDVHGKPVTIQRNYLDLSGRKAQVQCDKKTMPIPGKDEEGRTVNGAACRLDPPGPWLSVSEGFANAYTGRCILGLPAWCTTVAHSLEVLDLPEVVRFLIIWGDLDGNGRGQEASAFLRDRAERSGRQVLVLNPPEATPKDAKGNIDWNAAVKHWGLDRFRKSSWLRETRTKIENMSRDAGLLRSVA